MKKELSDSLYASYPNLFPPLDRLGDSPFKQRGFEIGNGWYGIAKDLAESLSKLSNSIVVTQIKEKFGALRVYTSAPVDIQEAVMDLVSKAESKSVLTCTSCGDPCTRETVNFVIRTTCKPCLTSGKY
jgi:hypothetical protein